MDEELQKIEELIGEVKKITTKEVQAAKDNPVKSLIKFVISFWALKTIWNWFKTKPK